MTDFHRRSRAFLKALSSAASWMMQRNVGDTHWWRWQVLTTENPDPQVDRPVFDDQTAQRIFEELKGRNLLVEFPGAVDGTALPAYLMRYDIDGWDQAVLEGRPVYGRWLKLRRNWPLMVLIFVLTSLEDRTLGLVEKGVDFILEYLTSLLG